MSRPTPARDKIRALLSHPDHEDGLTCPQMQAMLGVPSSSSSVRNVMRDMHAAREVHVVSWAHAPDRAGRWGAVWRLGPGKDVPPPPPSTRQQQRAAWYKRNAAKLALKRRTQIQGLAPWVAVALPPCPKS